MARSKENLRSGYTTGACAAAATKASLIALVGQATLPEVTIRLPGGQWVTFVLHSCAFGPDEGRASVIKDAGDDPDVTHGAEIRARVTWGEGYAVCFPRGEGVGLVTKKGLPVPPGEPAINPVPRQMMADAVHEVLAGAGLAGRGVSVEISVPGGEALARKTFNPRLGIIGGVSILGTTGIVVPYSTEAWRASVLQAIDVATAQGCNYLALTLGASGERFARTLVALPEVAFVQAGPFFGDALRHCAGAGLARVSLVAMIGKLAKFAAGNESVHSQESRQDFAFLADLARVSGSDEQTAHRILGANTAQEASELVTGAGDAGFHERLCHMAWDFGRTLSGGSYELDVLLIDRSGRLIARFPG